MDRTRRANAPAPSTPGILEAYRSRVEAFCAHRSTADRHTSLEAFRTCYGRDPDLTCESASWTLHLRLAPEAQVGEDESGQVFVVLHGELLNDAGRSAAWVAEAFRRRGESVVRDLRGSFALIVVDRARDRMLVIPDRKGSRRLFHSEDGTGHYLTSDLRAQPSDEHALDVLGVGWLLAAGIPFNGRTPYDGIRVLRRAQVHELRPSGATSSEYWSHGLQEPEGDVDEADLVAKLKELMVQALRRRAEPGRDLFISLSGGFDSIGIASVLSRTLGLTGVRAFSYVHGAAEPGTDAHVARAVADKLGLPHRLYESYHGDLMEHLRANARLSEAAAVAAYEVDMWKELGPELAAAKAPIIFVGEERMGLSGPVAIETDLQLWKRAKFHELRLPSTVSGAFPRTLLRRINASIHEEVGQIIAQQPGAHVPNELRFQIGFDQRITHEMLPWRERFFGAHATVRNPWLDADVLDFMKHVPYHLLKGKTLYKRALADLAPDMLTITPAQREGYRADWRAEIGTHAPELRRWISTTESRLDDLVPPGFGLALLDEVERIPTLHRMWQDGVRRVRGRLRRANLLPEPRPAAAAHNVFRHWATLRMALER